MRISLTVLALAFPFGVLRSQTEPPLPLGARVRVTVVGPVARTQIGTYHGLRDTTVLLQTGTSSVRIPRGVIERLELSRGRRASVPARVVGFVVGAAAGGFALGCLANRDDYGVVCAGQDDTKVVVGAALGGLAGAVLGGALFRRERWAGVELP